MTQKTNSTHHTLYRARQRSYIACTTRTLLLQTLSCVGGLGILSSGLVWAQTGTSPDVVIKPTTKNAKSLAVAPRQSVTNIPNATSFDAPVLIRQKSIVPHSTSRASSLSVDRVGSVAVPSRINSLVRAKPTPPLVKTASNRNTDYSGAYIDPTNYSIGATGGGYTAPSRVVLMERSTGCKAVLSSGQGLSGSICGATAVPHFIARRSKAQYGTPTASVQLPRRIQNVEQEAIAPIRVGPISVSASGFRGNDTPAMQPGMTPPAVEPSQIALGSVTLPPRSGLFEHSGTIQPIEQGGVINIPEALLYPDQMQPSGQPGDANTGLLFPLNIPAPITSIFGWRIHPMTGAQSFHAGTDLGAPLGTPVLAAYPGSVVVANYMGGYGLAVILEHKKPVEQTLYGHLSQIFVQPGQWVDQGTVIGRVGSTGMSTGPHLHFEIRQLTPNGWVATDPGKQLEYAMAQLVQTLRIAQAPQQPVNGG